MKRTFILSVLAAMLITTVFTSCKTSRVWANKKKEKEPKQERNERRERERDEEVTYRRPAPPPPPRYYSTVALIITPRPGFVMKQDREGRFFHRTSQGYLYWKGYDNRFFLDDYYVRKVEYNRGEYDEWRRHRPSGR
jgi:Ni/Co efflux regulator RcnB